MTTHLIIARYNEDVRWVKKYLDSDVGVTIYNKGDIITGYIPFFILPNYGREAHTFLTHIVLHYDHLADWNVFLQGDPLPHLPDGLTLAKFIEKRGDEAVCPLLISVKEWGADGRFYQIDQWTQKSGDGVGIRRSDLSLADWLWRYIGLDLTKFETLTYTPGAMFGLTADVIRRNPVELYRYLLNAIPSHSNPEEAYYLERGWFYLFGKEPLAVKTWARGRVTMWLHKSDP